MAETVILAPRSPVPPNSHLRGTVLANSMRQVEERGVADAYWATLAAEHVKAMRELVATSWVPVEVALAHYQAMSVLIPDAAEQVAIGRESAARVQNAYIETLLRAMRASGAGVSMELVLAQAQKVFDRVMIGGSAAVYKTGMKDARIECLGTRMVQAPYFRNGWQGWFESSLGLVTRRVFLKQIPEMLNAEHMAFAVSWV
ncbi:hypothetical protein [Sandaracinus amylolyticus]|uniref:Uncharacterized protein n=1 Tax=Sandaracinus amylolyticus TaxID=927083 RepID=A0A0F6SEX5_9BACT|nr:hypothetical protein [Sandaracinus amylolyticus]AKF05954.1 hypothetical protein DB32_003103 [Sandaracinus amylolyticus]